MRTASLSVEITLRETLEMELGLYLQVYCHAKIFPEFILQASPSLFQA